MNSQCEPNAHSSTQKCAEYARDAVVRGVHTAAMDTAWFKARKKEVKTSDEKLALAVGRDRTTVTKVINGTIRFDLAFVDGFAALLKVTPEEVLSRVGVGMTTETLPESNATVMQFEGESLERPNENLPVWGSGLGAARMFEGEAVEQTDLNSGAILEYVRRPAILAGKREAYALHVQGSSMHPALPDGEIVAVCRNRPLSTGDNVVVYLRDSEEDDGQRSRGVLVKELVRRSASYVELRQYEPRLDFKVPMVDVVRIDRILTRREMMT